MGNQKINRPTYQKSITEVGFGSMIEPRTQLHNSHIIKYNKINKKYNIDHNILKTLMIQYENDELENSQTNEFLELLNKQISIYCNEPFSPNGLKSKFSKRYKLNSSEYSVEELTSEVLLKLIGINSKTEKRGRLEAVCEKLKQDFSLDALLRVETRQAIGDYVIKEKTGGRYLECSLNKTIRQDREKLEQKIQKLKKEGASTYQIQKMRAETNLGYFVNHQSINEQDEDNELIHPQIQLTKEYGFEPESSLEEETNMLNPINGMNYLLQNLHILTDSEQNIMRIKIEHPEKSQVDISNQVGTSSESVRQLIESSGKKYKLYLENEPIRAQLLEDPTFNINDYENIGFNKNQIFEQKVRILTDLIQIENISKDDIIEISGLTKGFVTKNLPKLKKELNIKTKIPNSSSKINKKERKPEKKIQKIKQQPKVEETIKIKKQEQSLYDSLTIEQKVKLAMYKPTKINFRTFNQDFANGKI